MAKAKSKVNKKISLILVLSLALIAFGVFGVLLSSRQNVKKSEVAETKNYPVDTVNDGVYTNYKYGYKFTYPTDVFVEQKIMSDISNGCWYNETNIDSPLDLHKDGIWLCVDTNIISDKVETGRTSFKTLVNRFNLIYNLNINESDAYGNTKINSINTDTFRQVVFFYKTPENRESEHSVSYGSTWLVGDRKYVNLFLAASENREDLLEKYKSTFDQVTSSFEFFDPSTYTK